MFEDQLLRLKASSLNDLVDIVISMKEMAREFEEGSKGNKYKLKVNHEKLTAYLHLYKESNDNIAE